nr:PQQ-binding-like beta-propeller repeat protein [Rhodococcus zopfii]
MSPLRPRSGRRHGVHGGSRVCASTVAALIGVVGLLASACGGSAATHAEDAAASDRAFGEPEDRLPTAYPTAPTAGWSVSAVPVCGADNSDHRFVVKVVTADTVLASCGSSARLVALDPVTGSVRWQSEAEPGSAGIFCADVPLDGAFVCTNYSDADSRDTVDNVRAYRESDGELMWGKRIDGLKQVEVRDNTLYSTGSFGRGSAPEWVGSGTGRDFRANWYVEPGTCIGDEIFLELEIGADVLTTGYHVIDRETGAVGTPTNLFVQAALPGGGFVAADCDDPTRITILDSAGNRVRTHSSSGDDVYTAGSVYILGARSEGTYAGYDAKTGDELWTSREFRIDRIVGDVMIGGDRTSYVGHSLSDGRELWRWNGNLEDFPDSGSGSSVVDSEGRVIGFTEERGGELVAFDPETGRMVWDGLSMTRTTTNEYPGIDTARVGEGFVASFGDTLTFYPPQ